MNKIIQKGNPHYSFSNPSTLPSSISPKSLPFSIISPVLVQFFSFYGLFFPNFHWLIYVYSLVLGPLVLFVSVCRCLVVASFSYYYPLVLLSCFCLLFPVPLLPSRVSLTLTLTITLTLTLTLPRCGLLFEFNPNPNLTLVVGCFLNFSVRFGREGREGFEFLPYGLLNPIFWISLANFFG